MTEPIEVAAALIRDEQGRYLIARRRVGTHLAGLWEFPGGKREVGESLQACLIRELREELAAEFAVDECFETVQWHYPEKSVVLHFFRCRLRTGTIEPREGQALAWVLPGHLERYDFPPADQALLAKLRAS